MIPPTLNNFYPNEYSYNFYYYLFSVKLDRSVGSCNTLNDLSKKVYIPNEIKDLNLSVFNMITGISELRKITEHISCEYKFRFKSMVK